MGSILEKLGTIGLVPVVKIENPDRAAGLGRALAAGGIPAAEVTFRTKSAAAAIGAMRAANPDLLVGAGTVLDRATARLAEESGASFIVSPGFDDAVVDFCLERGLPVLPGVNGPDGVMRGIAKGLSVLKFFPAVQSGGLPMIEALAGPFASIRYVPTGGIDAASLGPWARSPSILAVGGSWMVPPALIESGDWPGIEALCRNSVRALHGFRVVGASVPAPGAARGDDGLADSTVPAGFAELADLCCGLELAGEDAQVLVIACNSVERALARLSARGFSVRAGSEVREKSRIASVIVEPGAPGGTGPAMRLIRA